MSEIEQLKAELEQSSKTIAGLRASMHLIADRLKQTRPIVEFLNSANASDDVKRAWKDLVYTSGIRAGMEAECDPREYFVSKAELERVKRQNAAMREALQGAKGWIWSLSSRIFGERRREDYINSQQTWSLIMAALQPDAGLDHIAKESVRPLVEALRKAYTEINTIHARCGVPWWDTGKSDVAQEYFTSVVEESRSALDVARQLGLP